MQLLREGCAYMNLDTPEAGGNTSMRLLNDLTRLLDSRVGSWIPDPTFSSDVVVVL